MNEILNKIMEIKSWGQALLVLFVAVSSICVYILWENRDDIYNNVKLPKSKVYYVQKDLEILELLREINQKTGAIRACIVDFEPNWDDDSNLEKIRIFTKYEQVKAGVSGISESYQDITLMEIPMDWKRLYKERVIILNVVNDSTDSYLKYQLAKHGVSTRVVIAIYNKDGKITNGLMVDFNESNATIDSKLMFILEEYCRIFRYYL